MYTLILVTSFDMKVDYYSILINHLYFHNALILINNCKEVKKILPSFINV